MDRYKHHSMVFFLGRVANSKASELAAWFLLLFLLVLLLVLLLSLVDEGGVFDSIRWRVERKPGEEGE